MLGGIRFRIGTIAAALGFLSAFGAYTTKEYVDRGDSNAVDAAFGFITSSNSTGWVAADWSVLSRIIGLTNETAGIKRDYATKAYADVGFSNAVASSFSYLTVSNSTGWVYTSDSVVGRVKAVEDTVTNATVRISVEDNVFRLMDGTTTVYEFNRATKQDRLPYQTNAIPFSAITGFSFTEKDPTVPSWAKAANPPEGMPSTGIVSRAGTALYTYDGSKKITASWVGALPTTGGTLKSTSGSTVLEIGNGSSRTKIEDNSVTIGPDDEGTLTVGSDGYGGTLTVGGVDVMSSLSGKVDSGDFTAATNSLLKEAFANDKIIRMYLTEVSSGYEVRLNGEALSYDKIYDYATNRPVVIVRSNACYKPTYIGASEMMFDCTGTVGVNVQTRMLHLFPSGTIQLGDTKYLASQDYANSLLSVSNVTDFAAGNPDSIVGKVSSSVSQGDVGVVVTNVVNDYISTNTTLYVTNNALTIAQDGVIKWQESFGGYLMDSSSAQTVNCKDHAVTFVTATGEESLVIVPPATNLNNEARDFVVYINTSGTNSLDLAAFATVYIQDEAFTNAVMEKLTVLYFTEMRPEEWLLGRQELTRVRP